jgi:FAD:protein FMN transferase
MTGERLLEEPFRAMGTLCTVAVTAGLLDDRQARAALAASRGEIGDCERALSRFDPESDLTRLNAGAGGWVHVDERLVDALLLAVGARAETGGRFDPTILPALVAAGYDRTFAELDDGAGPTGAVFPGGSAIDLDPPGVARLDPGAAVDLGGIGKGFAADRALAAMRDAWPGLRGALVDLGGDIAVWGLPPGGGPWRLAIADPRPAGARPLGTLELRWGAVATSGRDRRRFGPEGSLHHLIDPETGAPAAGGPLAVTVVAFEGAEAEAHATALAVTPVEEAAGYVERRPHLSALLVPDGGDPVALGSLPLAGAAA